MGRGCERSVMPPKRRFRTCATESDRGAEGRSSDSRCTPASDEMHASASGSLRTVSVEDGLEQGVGVQAGVRVADLGHACSQIRRGSNRMGRDDAHAPVRHRPGRERDAVEGADRVEVVSKSELVCPFESNFDTALLQ